MVLLASDSVESLSEPSETRVAVSVEGVELPRVLVSKTIVGLAAVEADAEEGIAIKPVRDKRPVRTTAVVFLDSEIIFELRTVGIEFPSMIVCLLVMSLTLGPRQSRAEYQQAVYNRFRPGQWPLLGEKLPIGRNLQPRTALRSR